MKPLPPATREQVRELDRLAIEHYGISGLILMENAGHRCAVAAAEMLGGAEGRRVAVLCGGGNNGGDGFVIARHLTNWGADVSVLLLAEIDKVLGRGGDASINLEIVLNMDVPVREVADAGAFAQAFAGCADADLLVDALLGTGVHGAVRDPFAAAIRAINAVGRPVLAVDVPSGLDCNSGQPLGEAVRADRTVTFVLNKVGFTEPGAEAFTGTVQVAEISIPRQAVRQVISASRGSTSD
jgi:NAD(P)H-hydrate epimerase